jgi:hypothetical protein
METKAFCRKRLESSEGGIGKHERHDLMVYECNEITSSLWMEWQASDFVFTSAQRLVSVCFRCI